jgi:hypothetical protein
MKKLKKSKTQTNRLLSIALIMIALFANLAPITRAQQSSASSSPNSATPAPTPSDDALRRSCAEVIEDLKAAKKLIGSQDADIEKQKELNAIEAKISDGLRDLRTLDATEKQALRDALAEAKTAIAELKAENAELKKHQMTFWKAAKLVLIGVGAGFLIEALKK